MEKKDAAWWWKVIWGTILLGALGGMTWWLAYRATAIWSVLKHIGH